jgi:hypothetical protein
MGSAAHPVRLEQRHDVSGPRSRSDGLPAATRPRSHPAGCRIGLQHWPVSVIAPALRNPLTSPGRVCPSPGNGNHRGLFRLTALRHRLSRPEIANPTAVCTPWPSPRSATQDTVGSTTSATCQRERSQEALRCLKRRLSDLVYRQLIRDSIRQVTAGPGGHAGASTKSSAVGSTPTTDSSDQSLPGPTAADPTTTPRPTS